MTTVPLRRNRDFVLLQAGQLLSTAGTASTSVAYPLLVLAVSHSPAQAGLVGFARTAPYGLFGLLAGVAADRWNRKWLMITADVVRALAIGTLAVAVASGHAAVWQILVVAFVEGTGATVFSASTAGALRAVVPQHQLPAAAGAQETRRAAVRIAGPPLGGALYAVGRALPFAVDACSYVFSTVSLLAMRAQFQQRRERDGARLRAQVAEGLRFLWRQPFLRTTTVLYGVGNFLAPAMLLAIVVVGERQGFSAGEIGALSAAVGVGTLAGSLVSPVLRRVLSVRGVMLSELWTWLGLVAFVAWPSVYVLTAAMVVFGIAAPVTDSVVVAYRVAVTPDRLLGRVESVRSSMSMLVAPLGPLVVGALFEVLSARATVGLFALLGIGLAVGGTRSRALRTVPGLAEVAGAAA